LISVVCLILFVDFLQAKTISNHPITSCGSFYATGPPIPGQKWTIFFPHLYEDDSTLSFRYNYYNGQSSFNDNTRQKNSNMKFIQFDIPSSSGGFDFALNLYRYDPITNRQLCHSYGFFYENINNNQFYSQGEFPTYPMKGQNIGFISSVHSLDPLKFETCISYPSFDNYQGQVYSDHNGKNGNYLVVCSPVSLNSGSSESLYVEDNDNDKLITYILFPELVNFGPTNFQQTYKLQLNNVRTINFNTIHTSVVYVSYGLGNTKVKCQVNGNGINNQFVKCPGPSDIRKKTNILIGRFEFHSSNGILQEEGYAQIIIQ